MAVMEQWEDQWGASTSAAEAAQMPFLALLQGAAVVDTDDRNGGERKRAAAFAACTDLDLLESCVTQAAANNVTVAPAASRVESRRRKRPRLRPRAAPQQEKRKRPEEAESQRMTHIAVERNRRRLMNDHLASLRALIPTSYIPRVIITVLSAHICIIHSSVDPSAQ
jgi:hypothetical protein